MASRRAKGKCLADQERAQIAYRVQMYVRRDGAVRFPGREQDWLPLTT